MSKFDWRHADLEGDEKPKGRNVKKEMKNIVLSWLDQNDFYYYVPTGNLGRIEVQDNLL